MKTTIQTLFLLLLFSSSSFAQGGMHNSEKRDEIKKLQLDYIIKELQLTEKEQKDFIPMYNEFNSKTELIHLERRKKMMYFYQNSLNMTEQELTELGDYIVETEIQLADIEKIYHQKFKTILTPLKVILLHKAEQEFKRELFNKIKHKGYGSDNKS